MLFEPGHSVSAPAWRPSGGDRRTTSSVATRLLGRVLVVVLAVAMTVASPASVAEARAAETAVMPAAETTVMPATGPALTLEPPTTQASVAVEAAAGRASTVGEIEETGYENCPHGTDWPV